VLFSMFYVLAASGMLILNIASGMLILNIASTEGRASVGYNPKDISLSLLTFFTGNQH
jgi:hypothetical protein